MKPIKQLQSSQSLEVQPHFEITPTQKREAAQLVDAQILINNQLCELNDKNREIAILKDQWDDVQKIQKQMQDQIDNLNRRLESGELLQFTEQPQVFDLKEEHQEMQMDIAVMKRTIKAHEKQKRLDDKEIQILQTKLYTSQIGLQQALDELYQYKHPSEPVSANNSWYDPVNKFQNEKLTVINHEFEFKKKDRITRSVEKIQVRDIGFIDNDKVYNIKGGASPKSNKEIHLPILKSKNNIKMSPESNISNLKLIQKLNIANDKVNQNQYRPGRRNKKQKNTINTDLHIQFYDSLMQNKPHHKIIKTPINNVNQYPANHKLAPLSMITSPRQQYDKKLNYVNASKNSKILSKRKSLF